DEMLGGKDINERPTFSDEDPAAFPIQRKISYPYGCSNGLSLTLFAEVGGFQRRNLCRLVKYARCKKWHDEIHFAALMFLGRKMLLSSLIVVLRTNRRLTNFSRACQPTTNLAERLHSGTPTGFRILAASENRAIARTRKAEVGHRFLLPLLSRPRRQPWHLWAY